VTKRNGWVQLLQSGNFKASQHYDVCFGFLWTSALPFEIYFETINLLYKNLGDWIFHIFTYGELLMDLVGLE